MEPGHTGYISLLMLACQQGNLHQVQELIRPGVSNVLAADRNGRSALHYCAEYSRLDCAEFLLDALMTPSEGVPEDALTTLLNLADNEGFTVLLIATINGHWQMLKLLLERGASVIVQDKELHTPVHWATVCGHYECLEELLSANAEASLSDVHGAYPVHYAAQMSAPQANTSSSSAAVNDLSTPSPHNDLLVQSELRFLRRLIAFGVAVDPVDNDKRQPLLWAASAGAAEACRILVEAGASPQLGDKDGLTALHCAASRGHRNCIEILVGECGALVDEKDRHECTPLMYAATLGFIDCIRSLDKYGANNNHQDRKGRSAAHLAASKGQTECIMELEDLGGNIWLRNQKGDLPLHEAAQNSYIGVLDFLISRKPDLINAVNKDGRTCLHIAAIQKDMAVCRFLVENKCNVNLIMQNSQRQYFTALDLASMKNNTEMVKFLRLHGATNARKITKIAVARIQRTFQHALANRPHTFSTDILEEAFEAGTEPVSTFGHPKPALTRQRKSSVTSFDAPNMNEIDGSYLPHLPEEVLSSPSRLSSIVAKERHSDYDEIMDASVLEDKTRPHQLLISLRPAGDERSLTPSPSPSARQATTPVFEMSSLTLGRDDHAAKMLNKHSGGRYKYETDSDEDLQHPMIRAVSRGPALERIQSSSFHIQQYMPIAANRDLSRSLNELNKITSTLVDSGSQTTANSAQNSDVVEEQPQPAKKRSLASQAIQTTPRASISSQGSATSAYRTTTETQTIGSFAVDTDSVESISPFSSQSSLGQRNRSELSEFGTQTHVTSLASNTVAIQTNGMEQPAHKEVLNKRDSAVSPRKTVVQSTDTQTGTDTPRWSSTHTETQTTARSRIMKDSAVSARKVSPTEFHRERLSQTIGLQTTPRLVKASLRDSMSSPRSPGITPTENFAAQPAPSLFDGELSGKTSKLKQLDDPSHPQEKKNSVSVESSSGADTISTSSQVEESPWSWPGKNGERRKSRLTWDEAIDADTDMPIPRELHRKVSFYEPSLMDSSSSAVTMPEINDDEPEVEAEQPEEEPEETSKHDMHHELYSRFRPPTPRVPSLRELQKAPPDVSQHKRKNGANVAGLEPRNLLNGAASRKPQRTTNSNNSSQPTKPAFAPVSSKFLSSFNNTVYELGPQSIVLKYIDQLNGMRKKDTKYNEPVVLARLLPKFTKDMQNGGSSEQFSMQNLSTVKTFADWARFLNGQLGAAKAFSSTSGSVENPSIGGQSQTESDFSIRQTMQDVERSSNNSGSPTIKDVYRGSKNSPSIRKMPSPVVKIGSEDSENETILRFPEIPSSDKEAKLLPGAPIHHPFPWR